LFVQWSPWTIVASGVDADPAIILADRDTLHLAVRASADGTIRLRTRTKGAWGDWASLGAPSVGAASAPVIAAQDGQLLTVVVRGNDGLIYALACSDPAAMCAASAGRPDAWFALPGSPGTFIGKPSAAFVASGTLYVTAVAFDHTAFLIGSDESGIGFDSSDWSRLPGTSFASNDPDPQAVVQVYGDAVGFYARGPRGTLIDTSPWSFIVALGGLIESAPGVTPALNGEPWVHIAAVIEDHGQPGVWVKFFGSGAIPAPCNYNAPGTCAQCGCDLPNKPACAR
ncbi:MAG TPA: hypothetical protein VIF57_20295, partial [Polyangia bacterium]|jgi:hypothetical protein